MTEVLKVKRLHTDAQIPTRGSPASVGYDAYAYLPPTQGFVPEKGVLIPPGKLKMISLGIATHPPEGTYIRIAPRSGLAVKSGIDVLAGVVDRDYRGEVKVLLINNNDEPFRILHGMKVCQLILEQAKIVPVEEVTDLDETERGAGGFGSTGA